MLSTALNQKGATPGGSSLYGNSSSNYSALTGQTGQTPVSKALSNFSLSSNPTGPIKKQVVTTAGGDTHEIHYDTSGENGSDQKTTTPQSSNTSGTPSSDGKSAGPSVTYGGIIGQGVNASQNATNAGSANLNTGTGILNNIANTPNPTATTAQAGLLNVAQNGSPAVNNANAALLKFQKENPYMLAAQSNPNVAADVASGRTSLLGQVFGKEEQALTQNAQNQIAQEGQQIQAGNSAASQAYTGQGQNISAGSTIANTGLSGQGQGISGLGTNAGMLAPTSNIILRDPTTGNTVGNQDLTSLARTKGTLSGIESGASTASSALGGVQAQQTTQVEGYKSALQQGQNLQSQLGDLIKTFGLNPNDINVVNSGLQKIAQNTSSSQYKILSNYVNDIANTYAQILTPSGGSQTDMTRNLASSMLDATASGKSILDVMKSLDAAAQAKIAGVPTQGGSTSSSGSSTGGGLYDF